jgi:hypothetical protein
MAGPATNTPTYPPAPGMADNTSTAASSSVSVPVSWAMAFLTQIGAPLTQQNIDSIIAWGTAESGSPAGQQQQFGGWANYNPLNVVTQSNDGHTGQGGSQGDIANFGDAGTGATQSARLFKNNPNAAPIINALKASASVAEVNAAVNQFYSTWGGTISFAGITPDTTDSPVGTSAAPGDPTAVIGGGNSSGGVLNALGDLPIIGGAFKGLSAAAALEGSILAIFTNWRYVVEVFAGIAMMGLGIILILHDTGVDRKIGQGAQTAAVVAAA